MSRRRPYDDVKTIVAAVLGIPALVGSVYLMLVLVGIVWQSTNAVGGGIALVVGTATLTYLTYKSVELVRTAGGR